MRNTIDVTGGNLNSIWSQSISGVSGYLLFAYFIPEKGVILVKSESCESSIAEVKEPWSVIGWVTNNLLFWVPSCFGGHVKRLVPAAFAALTLTNPQWARVVGYDLWWFYLCVIHKEGLCPSIRDINRLMMMMIWDASGVKRERKKVSLKTIRY
jgi:hypothetical protein